MSNSNPPCLGIVVALREEWAAIRTAVKSLPRDQRARIHVARHGVGAAPAAQAALRLCQVPGLELLCSAGFSGGLSKELASGAVVLARGVDALSAPTGRSARASTRRSDAEALKQAEAALRGEGVRFHTGLLVAVATPATTAEKKRALNRAHGALAVDLESAEVARVAAVQGLGFFALRTICDELSDELPAEVGTFLHSDGRVRAGNVVRFALKGRENIRRLMGLKGRADQAAKALSRAWEIVLPALLERTDHSTNMR